MSAAGVAADWSSRRRAASAIRARVRRVSARSAGPRADPLDVGRSGIAVQCPRSSAGVGTERPVSSSHLAPSSRIRGSRVPGRDNLCVERSAADVNENPRCARDWRRRFAVAEPLCIRSIESRHERARRLRPDRHRRLAGPLRDPQAHGEGVPGGQPVRLGRRAHLLRAALAVPGADRARLDHRPVRRPGEDHADDHRHGHAARAEVGGRHVRGPGRVDHREPRRGGDPLLRRARALAVVGVRLRRRVHARGEHRLRDARGPAVLEAAAAAAAGHARDDPAAGRGAARARPHRPGRLRGRRPARDRLDARRPCSTSRSGRSC